MDKKTIYSKTGKGVLEIKNKAGKLSRDLVKVLTLVDGKSTVADLMAKSKFDTAEMEKAITQLSAGGYIKEFANTSTGMSPGGGGDGGSYVDDLDFTSSLSTSSAKSNPYQSAQTEWRQRESADRAKAEQDAKKKREQEEQAKKEQAAKQAREEAARLAKVEAERKAKEAAALKLREETERKAKIEAEAMAQTTRDLQKVLEAERKALEEAERKKQEEVARRTREEAEKRALEEAERKRKEDEERQRKEAEERRRREEEERKRKEEEDRKRKEEEERRRKEEAERKRKEEEERKRREEEERKRREEEERKRREEEQRKREEEERARREEEDRKRKEEEERKRKEEEERRLRREEEDRRRREEDERRRKEDEEVQAREREGLERQREEEDRRRREEDEIRRREDQERAAREEEERRQRAEEDDRRRREEDDRRRREEEERRREEEERARAPAASSEVPELDLSGLKSMEDRIAAEFEKQQAELRKREEEEERRRVQDEQARLAIERAEREEEARQEAERREAEDRERRERMEQERAEREARERKRQEEKEQRIREAEERKIAEAHERQRQEEMKVEAERRQREEALANRRKEQEERDRKRAEVQALKKQKAIRSPIDRAKPFVIGIVVVVALLIGGVQLIPMNSYIPAVEKLASDHIKEPVTIGSMKISILSGFSMNLENVRMGTTQDVKIDRVSLSPDFGSVFGDVKVVRRIDVSSMTVAQEVLPRLPRWMDAALSDKNVQVGRISIEGIKLESSAIQLPNVDADLQFNDEGGIERARLTDGQIDVNLTPRNNEIDIEVSATRGWTSPLGPKLAFSDISAKAVASGNQIRVSEFSALLYGGAAKGTANIQFGGPWTLEGDLTAERINLQELMAVFTSAAKSSGQLEARFRYSMQAPDLASLLKQPRVEGPFTVRKGDLDGVDLVRALQMGGRENVQGGATRFEEISGTLALANERYQFRNLRLASGLLSATGSFDVAPDDDINGRAFVELRSQAAQIRGSYTINGSLKAIVLKPN